MKDVISILQSRVAKRENVIALFEQARNYNNFFRHLIEQQKQDKRILAEIVRLRREIVDGKKGRKDVLELGCDRIEAHAKALEKSRKEVEELRAQIKELDAILDRFYRAEEI